MGPLHVQKFKSRRCPAHRTARQSPSETRLRLAPTRTFGIKNWDPFPRRSMRNTNAEQKNSPPAGRERGSADALGRGALWQQFFAGNRGLGAVGPQVDAVFDE